MRFFLLITRFSEEGSLGKTEGELGKTEGEIGVD